MRVGYSCTGSNEDATVFVFSEESILNLYMYFKCSNKLDTCIRIRIGMAQSMQCSDSASICHISSKPQSKRVLGAVNLWLPLASLYKTRVFNLRGVVFLSIVFVMMSSSLPHTAVIFRYNLFSFIYLLVLLISTLLPGPTLKSQKGTMCSEILVICCISLLAFPVHFVQVEGTAFHLTMSADIG